MRGGGREQCRRQDRAVTEAHRVHRRVDDGPGGGRRRAVAVHQPGPDRPGAAGRRPVGQRARSGGRRRPGPTHRAVRSPEDHRPPSGQALRGGGRLGSFAVRSRSDGGVGPEPVGLQQGGPVGGRPHRLSGDTGQLPGHEGESVRLAGHRAAGQPAVQGGRTDASEPGQAFLGDRPAADPAGLVPEQQEFAQHGGVGRAAPHLHVCCHASSRPDSDRILESAPLRAGYALPYSRVSTSPLIPFRIGSPAPAEGRQLVWRRRDAPPAGGCPRIGSHSRHRAPLRPKFRR